MKINSRCYAFAAMFAIAISADASTFQTAITFASGAAVGATGPDSITVGNGSVWISYSNGADSQGMGGNSTVVQYSMSGGVLHTYSIAGSVDGLKIDPATGLVWALQNQDGNSSLTIINPLTNTTRAVSYASTYPMQGYDDIAFAGTKTFLSLTNPARPRLSEDRAKRRLAAYQR